MKINFIIKENHIFPFYCCLSILIFLVSLLFYVGTSYLQTLLVGFMIFYIMTVFYVIIYYGMFSLYAIYLYASCFFLYNCFILTLLGYDNFLVQTFPKKYSFNENVGAIFIISCFMTVFVTHITYILFESKRWRTGNNDLSIDKTWRIAGEVLMLVFLLPVLTKSYIQIDFIRSHGYHAMYTGEMSEIKYPIWTAGAYLFFHAGYFIFLASKPPKQNYIFFSILFFIMYLFDSLKGGRSMIICVLLVIIYFYQINYGKKIKFTRLLLMASIVIIVAFYLGRLRSSYGDNTISKNTMDVKEIVKFVLWNQTTTRAVPLLIIRGELKYRHYPFVFYPLVSLLKQKSYPPNSMLSLYNNNNTSQVLMGNISPTASISGMGYGSAFLGEAYDFLGMFGVILFSILIGILLKMFDKRKMNCNKFIFPLLYSILLIIPLLPRAELFRFLYKFNYLLVTYIFIFLIQFIRKYVRFDKND